MAVSRSPTGPINALKRQLTTGVLAPNPGAQRLLPLPTVNAGVATISALAAATAISSPVTLLTTDARFQLLGHRLGDNQGSGSYLGVSTTPNLNSGGGAAANANQTPYALRWGFAGQSFEIKLKASEGKYRLIVNGVAHNAGYSRVMAGSPDYTTKYLPIDLGARGVYDVLFETTDNIAIYGILAARTETIFYPHTPVGPRVIVLGDSFTAGQYGQAYPESALLLSWVYYLSKYLGWPDTWASGSGGTGYLEPSAATGHVKFRDRLAADVTAYSPDVIIVAGGFNDAANYTGAAVQAEAILLFDAIRQNNSNAKLIVIGPWATGGTPSAGLVAMRDATKAAAVNRAHLYIDTFTGQTYDKNGNAVGPAQGKWWTGTGKVGTTASDGNADFYVQADGVHPSVSGHQYIGYRAASAISVGLPI